MATGLSLANKCQLLFGVAVVVLLGGVLAVVASRREGGLPGPREDHVAFVRGFFDTQIERVNEATATGSGGVGAAGGGRQNDPSPPP